MTPAPARPLSGASLVGLLAAVAVLVAGAAALAPDGRLIASFWPAAAAELLVLSLTPRRWWGPVALGVALAILAGDLLGGRTERQSVAHAVLEAVAALAATAVLTDAGRRGARLADVSDFLRLAAGGLTSGLLVAGPAVLLDPRRELDPGLTSALTVLLTHLAAVLVLLPPALLVVERLSLPARRTHGRTGHRPGPRVEQLAQVLLLVLACVLTFSRGGEASVTAFAPVLVLTWAAIRLDLAVVLGEVVAVACLVTAQAATGAGPFAASLQDSRLGDLGGSALVQAYLVCVTLLVLPLSVATRHTTALLAQITADGRIFRRNFTESLVGMAFVEPAPGGTDLVVVDLNETALDILGGPGLGAADPVGRPLGELLELGPDYAEVLPDLVAGRLEGWRADVALTGPRAGHVTVQLSPISEPGDAPVFAVQVVDVTTEHQARRALEVAQQLTATTLDTTACIIMVIDLDGTVVRVNAATSALTGWEAEDLLGRPVWETAVAPADAADVTAFMAWPNRSGEPVVREGDVLTRRGERLRVVWSTNVVRDDLGLPMWAVLTGIDVTAERTVRGLVNHLMEASYTTALVGIDTSGRINVVNSGVSHLLGYDRDELVGQPFQRLLETGELLERTGSDSAAAAFATLVRGLRGDGETRPSDWTWVTRSGEHRLVSMTLSVAQDAFAAQSGYLCVARDVAETRQSQQMLMAALDKERMAVERLRSLDQAKNQFVSTVSHELRTPVTSIVGYAEMIRDGSMVDPLPAQVPLLDTIDRNGQRLIAMIDDLLMLGGLDSGTVSSRLAPLDLATVVGPVEQSVRPLLAGRHLDLVVQRPAAAVGVLGDRDQLERVLSNLISNAVKFTEDGGRIEVCVGVEGDEAVMTVRDDGIGIPAEEQDELFSRFFRSTTAQTRQIQGTGLGLSIVSEIVAGHGGRVEVESAHLQGSTFTVRLPLAHEQRLTPAG